MNFKQQRLNADIHSSGGALQRLGNDRLIEKSADKARRHEELRNKEASDLIMRRDTRQRETVPPSTLPSPRTKTATLQIESQFCKGDLFNRMVAYSENLNIRLESHGRNEVIYPAIPSFMYSQAGRILKHQLTGLLGSRQ